MIPEKELFKQEWKHFVIDWDAMNHYGSDTSLTKD